MSSNSMRGSISTSLSAGRPTLDRLDGPPRAAQGSRRRRPPAGRGSARKITAASALAGSSFREAMRAASTGAGLQEAGKRCATAISPGVHSSRPERSFILRAISPEPPTPPRALRRFRRRRSPHPPRQRHGDRPRPTRRGARRVCPAPPPRWLHLRGVREPRLAPPLSLSDANEPAAGAAAAAAGAPTPNPWCRRRRGVWPSVTRTSFRAPARVGSRLCAHPPPPAPPRLVRRPRPERLHGGPCASMDATPPTAARRHAPLPSSAFRV